MWLDWEVTMCICRRPVGIDFHSEVHLGGGDVGEVWNGRRLRPTETNTTQLESDSQPTQHGITCMTVHSTLCMYTIFQYHQLRLAVVFWVSQLSIVLSSSTCSSRESVGLGITVKHLLEAEDPSRHPNKGLFTPNAVQCIAVQCCVARHIYTFTPDVCVACIALQCHALPVVTCGTARYSVEWCHMAPHPVSMNLNSVIVSKYCMTLYTTREIINRPHLFHNHYWTPLEGVAVFMPSVRRQLAI